MVIILECWALFNFSFYDESAVSTTSVTINFRDSKVIAILTNYARDYEEVREVIPHIGPLAIVIPLRLFLDFLRDPVFPRGLNDSQSNVPICFSVSIAERFPTQ